MLKTHISNVSFVFTGIIELCPHKRSSGWFSQGVYAEYTILPEYCVYKIPLNMAKEVAAVAEPFAICVGVLERGRFQKDDFTQGGDGMSFKLV